MTVSRSLLSQAFPNNPRLRLEFEAALNLVDSLETEATDLKAQLDEVARLFETGDVQAASEILTKISALTDKVGAIELTGDGQVTTRGIDGADPATLLTRGTSYSILVGIGGKGVTGSRPTTVPEGSVAIYFDTTLHATTGKPIFGYTVSGVTTWVDSTGAAV